MLRKVKFSTIAYSVLVLSLAIWIIKSFFDLQLINKKLKSQKVDNVVLVEQPIKENLSTPKYRRFSDGIFVNSQEEQKTQLIAMIIENIIESRPQSGLNQASVVYEASAEGGITRFLAIFDNFESANRIGPIRSARPYFLDWSEEFGKPIFLHVGGSPEALKSIKYRQIFNFDEFFWRYDYYLRVADRYAPHDTYTNQQLLQKVKSDIDNQNLDYESWIFKDDADLSRRGDLNVDSIDFSKKYYDYEKNYFVSWQYNKEENSYTRYQGEVVHTMEDGLMIKAKNIIILYTDEKVVDDIGRLKVRTLGEGKAEIFRDGLKIDGTWKKEATTNRTRFYEGDKEVEFNAGTTWIEVVPIK